MSDYCKNNSYSHLYLKNAADTFGAMMDYAVNARGLDGDFFLHMFVTSGLAQQFERGNPRVIAGMSGIELAIQAIKSATGETDSIEKPVDITEYKTPEFWAGWALAHYQWHCAKSFSSILIAFPFSEIVKRYHPLHEADISKFYAVADNIVGSPKAEVQPARELLQKEHTCSRSATGGTPEAEVQPARELLQKEHTCSRSATGGTPDFEKSDLIPAIVTDFLTNDVLMLAFMNRESFEKTLESGYTWFWSRSRGELWNKGATSGNLQKVVEIYSDCDNDTLLVKVEQTGPACHTGERSCFFRKIMGE